ncbi:methyltransferase domain-containing protein [Halovulum dunhuangense]|uniref:Methyltransferase domain-containing protein n=1 Tax=Halovulum dunhuangense TaxID=1505036 RepID=A0A849KYY3_9RHOB|nr:methyltransferase domain-containing protein [Halovulum dunhuangense]
MSAAPGLAARRAAAQLLAGVLDRRQTLAELSASADGPLAAPKPEERARASVIALGVLRQLERLDAVLSPMLRKPPPPPVHHALRIAAWEVLVDGVADYAAVDGAVRLVQGLHKHRHLTGLTNAVARRLAREGAEAWAALPPPSRPVGWLGPRIVKAWGREAAAAIAEAHLGQPPLDLTPRTPAEAAALAETLGAELLPTGSLRLRMPGQVSALPGYAEGAWWVQDAAAALPVRLLGDVRGLRIVDLCAAPGGKTMQLAAAGAEVEAVDLSAPRMERVRENLGRTRLPAQVVVADALDWAPDAPVDVVVLDAPCSATGTLRRHPDLPHARPDPDIRPLLELQARLIDRALGWLKPGGRLLYCTCSLLPEEGERQIEHARDRHPGLRVAGAVPPEGLEPGWITDAGHLRLRPDYWSGRGGMDGFFATVLSRD